MYNNGSSGSANNGLCILTTTSNNPLVNSKDFNADV